MRYLLENAGLQVVEVNQDGTYCWGVGVKFLVMEGKEEHVKAD